eukprot:scaffold5.g946.t1
METVAAPSLELYLKEVDKIRRVDGLSQDQLAFLRAHALLEEAARVLVLPQSGLLPAGGGPEDARLDMLLQLLTQQRQQPAGAGLAGGDGVTLALAKWLWASGGFFEDQPAPLLHPGLPPGVVGLHAKMSGPDASPSRDALAALSAPAAAAAAEAQLRELQAASDAAGGWRVPSLRQLQRAADELAADPAQGRPARAVYAELSGRSDEAFRHWMAEAEAARGSDMREATVAYCAAASLAVALLPGEAHSPAAAARLLEAGDAAYARARPRLPWQWTKALKNACEKAEGARLAVDAHRAAGRTERWSPRLLARSVDKAVRREARQPSDEALTCDGCRKGMLSANLCSACKQVGAGQGPRAKGRRRSRPLRW